MDNIDLLQLHLRRDSCIIGVWAPSVGLFLVLLAKSLMSCSQASHSQSPASLSACRARFRRLGLFLYLRPARLAVITFLSSTPSAARALLIIMSCISTCVVDTTSTCFSFSSSKPVRATRLPRGVTLPVVLNVGNHAGLADKILSASASPSAPPQPPPLAMRVLPPIVSLSGANGASSSGSILLCPATHPHQPRRKMPMYRSPRAYAYQETEIAASATACAKLLTPIPRRPIYRKAQIDVPVGIRLPHLTRRVRCFDHARRHLFRFGTWQGESSVRGGAVWIRTSIVQERWNGRGREAGRRARQKWRMCEEGVVAGGGVPTEGRYKFDIGATGACMRKLGQSRASWIDATFDSSPGAFVLINQNPTQGGGTRVKRGCAGSMGRDGTQDGWGADAARQRSRARVATRARKQTRPTHHTTTRSCPRTLVRHRRRVRGRNAERARTRGHGIRAESKAALDSGGAGYMGATRGTRDRGGTVPRALRHSLERPRTACGGAREGRTRRGRTEEEQGDLHLSSFSAVITPTFRVPAFTPARTYLRTVPGRPSTASEEKRSRDREAGVSEARARPRGGEGGASVPRERRGRKVGTPWRDRGIRSGVDTRAQVRVAGWLDASTSSTGACPGGEKRKRTQLRAGVNECTRARMYAGECAEEGSARARGTSGRGSAPSSTHTHPHPTPSSKQAARGSREQRPEQRTVRRTSLSAPLPIAQGFHSDSNKPINNPRSEKWVEGAQRSRVVGAWAPERSQEREVVCVYETGWRCARRRSRMQRWAGDVVLVRVWRGESSAPRERARGQRRRASSIRTSRPKGKEQVTGTGSINTHLSG
ncbi:hypothetical protein C8F04DRAFT_1178365 [Mycena alexandri]|uniref:Uncharacterized protein n=1 Tax=Mycena alexandri TaxID=1745969 RepID=A0AAD6X7Y8_9AGAR|nr:hypothetical protein C8F04DRAFT_1178365 [Mycena alexandri]